MVHGAAGSPGQHAVPLVELASSPGTGSATTLPHSLEESPVTMEQTLKIRIAN